MAKSTIIKELANNQISMNVDTKHYVYPSFVDIIKQLSPMDAKVLEAMKQEQSPIPVVTVRLNFKESKSYHELLIDYSIDLFQLFGDTSILSASLQNLDRLGIIKIRYDQVVKPDERFLMWGVMQTKVSSRNEKSFAKFTRPKKSITK